MKGNKFLFAVLILSFMLQLSVYGQDVIINTGQEGSIIIHKIAVENLEDYTTPATGLVQDTTGMNLIENITFTVTRVEDDTVTVEDAQVLEGAGAYTNSIATNNLGVAEFTGLAHGIYLVKEEPSSSVSSPVDDFLVNVPMTNPTGTGWIYEINVYPKNQLLSLPEFGMNVSGRDVQYASVPAGEEATWIMASEIPRDIETAVLFRVNCTVNEFLDFRADSVDVYGEDREGQRVQLTVDDDYILTQGAQNFSVEINGDGKAALAPLAVDADDTYTPVLYIEYATGLNYTAENFADALGTALYNDAELLYTTALNKENTIAFPEENRPYVYTGGFNITKFDARTDDLLPDAVFRLYTDIDEARNGTNPVLKPGEATPWELTTNGEGKAFYYGLAYGEANQPVTADATTYYLVEVQAPEGYNLLGSIVNVDVNAASHLNPVPVQNRSGFILPVTGGAGTAMFTAAGLIIVGLACYVLFGMFLKKRT